MIVAAIDPGVAQLQPADITTASLRAAFARYVDNYAGASIQRCWSTWKVLCHFLFSHFLFTAELIALNPIPRVGQAGT